VNIARWSVRGKRIEEVRNPIAFAGEMSRQWFWTCRVLDASLHRPYCGPIGRRTALCQWASRLYRRFG